MTSYIWAVSAGGTITSGGTATNNTVTVTWNTAGAQTVSVNYTNANSCTAASPTSYPVTVNALPVPTITGPATSCVGTAGVVYSTEALMTGYTWTISAGGTITAGTGTNSITVTWNTAGAQSISVNYTNGNGCTASAATLKNVTVNALPVPTITGLATVCAGTTGITYTTETGMTGYSWSVSGGGSITAGSGTNVITVTWTTAGAQTVSVNYTNTNGMHYRYRQLQAPILFVQEQRAMFIPPRQG
jgi:protein-S-isoprenylcysteine O-methyltransferase Ste14